MSQLDLFAPPATGNDLAMQELLEAWPRCPWPRCGKRVHAAVGTSGRPSIICRACGWSSCPLPAAYTEATCAALLQEWPGVRRRAQVAHQERL